MPASPRLALVVTDVPWLLEHEHDLEPLLAELTRQGVAAEAAVWHDASVDWSAFDLIVMRCPWDYSLRTPEFLAWLDALPAGRVLNPPELKPRVLSLEITDPNPGGQGQVLHRLVHARELTALHLEVASDGGTDGNDHRVVASTQLRDIDVGPDGGPGPEPCSLG